MKLDLISSAVVILLCSVMLGCDNGDKPIADEKNGVMYPKSPTHCVILYYESVMNCDYKQYQVVVRTPMDNTAFKNRCERLMMEMEERNLIRRSAETVVSKAEKSIDGISAVVFANSPWGHNDVKYEVVQEGVGYKIKKEM